MNHWRFLDTGSRTAAENMALDQTLLATKNIYPLPNTIRFLQFKPHAVLLGYHQSLEQEIRTNFCKKQGIDINRRITGGGTIYCDENQLGWEIICDKDFFKVTIADTRFFKTLCQPAITALKDLGITASFRPRNDIEVQGRKISGTGGTEDQNVFLFQGTLLVDFDITTMVKALRIPIEKLQDKEIDHAKERVTCLTWELGSPPPITSLKQTLKKAFEKEFHITLTPTKLTPQEQKYLNKTLKKYQSQKWINKIAYPKTEQQTLYSLIKTKGGIIRATLMVNARFNRIQSALITGDFFTYPSRTIYDLEATLKDIPIDIPHISQKITEFFQNNKPHIPDITPQDFTTVIKKALEKMDMVQAGIPFTGINHIFTVNASFTHILHKKPRHLLLPYCAKSLTCGYRHTRDCTLCDECSISKAITLGKENNMAITTILNFEDLMTTLDAFQSTGVTSYIGCCCEAFYIKHFIDFEKTQVPGILIDIQNSTCYDLGQQNEAYKGTFESQTHINTDLLKKVINATKI